MRKMKAENVADSDARAWLCECPSWVDFLFVLGCCELANLETQRWELLSRKSLRQQSSTLR
jgi:hypothetical protein